MSKSSIEEIASLTVHNAFWAVGGSRGVCDEEIILTVHWHWFKLSWLPFHYLYVKKLYVHTAASHSLHVTMLYNSIVNHIS